MHIRLTIIHTTWLIAQAWSPVTSKIIKKCFNSYFGFWVLTREVSNGDPLLDLNDQDRVAMDEEAQDRMLLDTLRSADKLASID